VFRSKPKASPALRVWRISDSAPQGEWVDILSVTQIARQAAKSRAMRSTPAEPGGHWLESSFDLRSGADVTEDPGSIWGDLFDELFLPEPNAAKGTGQ
jgi:hypothetical protein